MKVLIVAAHPDDEILGVGATISKHAAQGDQIDVLIIGDGITSRFNKSELKSPKVKKLTDKIKKCAIKASKILGVNDTFFYGYQCCRFDAIGALEITKIIEKHIGHISPDILYTHHYGDVNNDHRLVFNAVMSAVRPLPELKLSRILSFETPSSTDWAPPITSRLFTPNVFIEIDKFFNKKIESLKVYTTEIREFPHPRSVEALTAYAKRWGAVAGVKKAEAFELIREVSK